MTSAASHPTLEKAKGGAPIVPLWEEKSKALKGWATRLYRLTSETVTADPANHNGLTTYTYDPVGNRQVLKSNGVTVNTYNYDANDRLTSDVYDNDGNTTSSTGITNTYDFENHLIQHGAVSIVYDGDGNRVSETVGGVTTKYLVDTQNPTGYAQVVDELQNGAVTRTYTYGLERINENQVLNSAWTPSRVPQVRAVLWR